MGEKQNIHPQQIGKKFLWVCRYLRYCKILPLSASTSREKKKVFICQSEFEYNMRDYKVNTGHYYLPKKYSSEFFWIISFKLAFFIYIWISVLGYQEVQKFPRVTYMCMFMCDISYILSGANIAVWLSRYPLLSLSSLVASHYSS